MSTLQAGAGRSLRRIATPGLRRLAEALESGRLPLPCTDAAVGRLAGAENPAALAAELADLAALGASPPALAAMLRLLAEEREATAQEAERVDLAWSGPELPGARSRETGSVLREMFAGARHDVLVSTYALDGGERAREILRPLADRMAAVAGLRVRLFVNVPRSQGRTDSDSVLLREFAEAFRRHIWPDARLPEVYFDPRSLDIGVGPRACLHAKCAIIDGEIALVTSANFTEAAQERNVEAGVLVRDAGFARALRAQFDSLVGAGSLRRVPGIE